MRRASINLLSRAIAQTLTPLTRKNSYAKSHPNGRSWLTTALSPRIILLCPVEAYPSLTSGLAEDLKEQIELLGEDYREISEVLSGS